jgi:pimeloyl-ACP methyl ester carboxylesterase
MTAKPRSRRRSIALTLVVPAVLAAGLVACGNSPASTPGSAAPSSAAAPASPTGSPAASTLKMITVDGRRLAFHVTPGHLPAIVLDAGGGEDSSYWQGLVPRLSQDTGSMIITYDRAGLGDSDEVPGPWDVHSAVSDLQAGLRQLGVTQKVLLVSHSQAGEVATYFARANPQLVSGAVLVDANLPPFFTDAEIARLVAANAPQIEEVKKQPSTKQNRQLIATAANFGPVHHDYHQVSWPTTVPAIVMVSTKTPFDGSPEDAQRWRDAAATFAKAGPDRELVTAEGSSHDIPLDRPQLVLDEIEQMASR